MLEIYKKKKKFIKFQVRKKNEVNKEESIFNHGDKVTINKAIKGVGEIFCSY